MAEWLVEEGIGEHRAILPGPGPYGIVAARLHWPGRLTAGQVEDAILTRRPKGSLRGIASFAGCEEALVDRLPPAASEGARLRLLVVRPALREAGRQKLAQARPTDKAPVPAQALGAQLAAEGKAVRTVRHFPADADWNALWLEVAERRVAFAGGALVPYPTPAMLLVDVDGEAGAAPAVLARAAICPLAGMLRRWDLAGNIGVDFPTIADKAGRKGVDAALAAALANWPHEHTAMNGFGFVQIVARLERPSLLALIAGEPAAAAARRLLRAGERLDGCGITRLSSPPAVAAAIRADWIAELERRTGRPARVTIDEALRDDDLGHAQLVSD